MLQMPIAIGTFPTPQISGRRAPRVPGLGLSPQPPADTPNRMRQRRRPAPLQCRNRMLVVPSPVRLSHLWFTGVDTRRIGVWLGFRKNLSETDCRVPGCPGCVASFGDSKARQWHERVKHKFIFH